MQITNINFIISNIENFLLILLIVISLLFPVAAILDWIFDKLHKEKINNKSELYRSIEI